MWLRLWNEEAGTGIAQGIKISTLPQRGGKDGYPERTAEGGEAYGFERGLFLCNLLRIVFFWRCSRGWRD
jgi:hypothetical protein